ncbi:hypothetical protein [Paenibacillus sp. CMAA1364]
MMISQCYKRSFMVTMLVAFMSMLFVMEASASEAKVPGALTTPPPQEMVSPLTFNPSFKYLYDGQLSLNAIGNLKVKLTVNTTAYEVVNSIGADVTIQRWTGSDWVSVQTTVLSTTSSDMYTGSASWIVTKGYYYRGKSNHWIWKGSLKEESVLYTASSLITE